MQILIARRLTYDALILKMEMLRVACFGKLPLIELSIKPILSNQRFVITIFNNFPQFHNQNPVSIAHRAKSVGDN